VICMKCNKDLAACICPDLEKRLEVILKSKFLHVGADYQARIRAQSERNKAQTTKTE